MGITASLLYNFGGIAPSASPRFSVLPVPYDLTSSCLSGMRNGPKAVIEASTHMELYDEELKCEPYLAGIETLDSLEPTTTGPEHMIEKVEEASAEILKKGRIPVIIGGEHSVTPGEVLALKKNCRRYRSFTKLWDT